MLAKIQENKKLLNNLWLGVVENGPGHFGQRTPIWAVFQEEIDGIDLLHAVTKLWKFQSYFNNT